MRKILTLFLLCALAFGAVQWFSRHSAQVQDTVQEFLESVETAADADVDEPAPGTDPAPPVFREETDDVFDFCVTEAYLNYLLEKYQGALEPLKSAKITLEKDAFVLTGELDARKAAEMLSVNPALEVLFPDCARYELRGVPKVEDNRLSACVESLSVNGSEFLRQALFSDELLGELSACLTVELSRFLPENYRLARLIVADGTLYAGFSVE